MRGRVGSSPRTHEREKEMSRIVAVALVGLLLAGGVRAEDKVVQPFNGTDLKGWKFKGKEERSQWVVGRCTVDEKDARKFTVTPIAPEASGGPEARQMINAKTGVDIY